MTNENDHDLREALAALEHDRWASWQKHLHSGCDINASSPTDLGDNSLIIPATLVQRWERQIATPYADLSEREKDSDRTEADKTIALLRELGALAPEASRCPVDPLRPNEALKALTNLIQQEGPPSADEIDILVRRDERGVMAARYKTREGGVFGDNVDVFIDDDGLATTSRTSVQAGWIPAADGTCQESSRQRPAQRYSPAGVPICRGVLPE